MLRTFLVLAIIAFGLRHAVRGPFYAVLFYLWVAYFRPELWLWSDWLASINLSFYVGVFALLWGLLTFQLRWDLRILLTLLMVLQSLWSTLASSWLALSWPYWVDFAKSIAITWLLASLIDTPAKFRTTLLVIGFSLGFETAKQGWLQLVLNPGGKNFNDIAFLGDNNGVAIGMLILCAIFVALARTAKTKGERWVHRFLSVGVLYRGIITYSRGGFISATVMGLLYFLRSKRKLAAAVGLVVVVGVIAPVLPNAFWERMGTLSLVSQSDDERGRLTNEQSGDLESALSRFHFWKVAVQMANDHPFTGVGHNAYMMAYDLYDSSHGKYGFGRAVHSSWFGVIGELGYPGITLYLLIFALALLSCRTARRVATELPEATPLREYAIALETSLIVIMVGGSFVTFQYSEMLWHIVGLSIALRRIAIEAQERAVVKTAEPAAWSPFMPLPSGAPAPASGTAFYTLPKP